MTKPHPRTTRQRRSGNAFFVDIPGDLAYSDPNQELEIEAVGDTRVLRPKGKRVGFDETMTRMAALRAQGAMGPDGNAMLRPEWPEHRSPK